MYHKLSDAASAVIRRINGSVSSSGSKAIPTQSSTMSRPENVPAAGNFQCKYYIAGTMQSKDGFFALIGGKVFHEGDIIEGAEVARIRDGVVEFEKNCKRWTQKQFGHPGPNWQ